MNKKILIIEDERRMRRILQLLLEGSGYEVKAAADGFQGIDLWGQWQPDVVLSDIKMPSMDGFQVLDYKITNQLNAPLILLTAFGTIDMAVDAIKRGAFDYITKPFDNDRVLALVQQAISDTIDDPSDLVRESKTDPTADDEMIGSSAAIAAVRDAIAMVAATPTSVMIIGESGTGKGLVARAIHDQSQRRDERMVSVNCASIPRNLLESELFGHRKGAFTGAVGNRTGAFLEAHRGILFLDEIGDLPLDLQPKLLHAVEEKAMTPIGDDQCHTVDVKIISATNCDIRKMIENGLFRSDLYYRLNTFLIDVPPLRQRREDICELAEHFMAFFAKNYHRPAATFDQAVKRALECHHWPGNIRELRNVMERAVLSCQQTRLSLQDLPPELAEAADHRMEDNPTPYDLKAQERRLIVESLAQCNGNQVQAARILKITRNTLRYRIKKFGITM
jgi:two-component system, NtrC family, response regulator